MLGWMIVFALMALIAALCFTAGPAAASASMKLATYVFGGLFLACVLTSVARGRA